MALRSRSFRPLPFLYEVEDVLDSLPDWKRKALKEAADRDRARAARVLAEVEGCEYKQWLKDLFKAQGCMLCGKFRPPCHVHHVRTRGARGKAEDQVPLCCWCHDEGGTKGFRSLEVRFGKNLWTMREDLAEQGRALGYLPVEMCSNCERWHSSRYVIDQLDTSTEITVRVCTIRCAPVGPA